MDLLLPEADDWRKFLALTSYVTKKEKGGHWNNGK